MILAIDPGNTDSAYTIIDDNYKPVQIGKITNAQLRDLIKYNGLQDVDRVVIEMVASYGMAVGAEVFETVFWIGRFFEAARNMPVVEIVDRLYRKDVKLHLCQSLKAKDGNIRQALIDRFGIVGTKKNPGWFYGFAADIWAAYAVGVTYLDKLKGIQ
jgi:hypothetical protein